MYFLPRRVGLARAKELVFTGRRVGAAGEGCAALRRARALVRGTLAAWEARLAAKGFDFIALGSDSSLLRAGAQAALKAVREGPAGAQGAY